MKGPRHWRTPDLPGRFTWVQPFLMCLCISTKTFIKNVNRVFQPALPNFRTVDGFALSPSVIQCAIHLALGPNNINNKNKDKKPERGLMGWCFQALRQWSERCGEECEVAGSEQRYRSNQRGPVNGMQKGYVSCNLQLHRKDAEPGKTQKRIKTIKSVKSY